MKFSINKFILNIQILTLAAALLLPFVGIAQTPEETDRCKEFKNLFQIKNMNIMGDTPFFCSASQLITGVISLLLIFAGTISALFLVVGGYWYLTAAGNDEQVEKGKKTVINSILGLVIIILAFTIVRIVAGTLSGVK